MLFYLIFWFSLVSQWEFRKVFFFEETVSCDRVTAATQPYLVVPGAAGLCDHTTGCQAYTLFATDAEPVWDLQRVHKLPYTDTKWGGGLGQAQTSLGSSTCAQTAIH